VAAMVIEVPEELKDLGEAMAETLAAVKKEIGGVIGGRSIDYDSVECGIAEGVAKIERAGHRAILQALDIDSAAIVIEGKRHARVGRAEATYYTMAGPLVIERALYRECGLRNATTVDAVSLRAGVVGDGWLPRTARAMAHDVQRATSREAEASAREHKRLEYSRSSFERVAHAVGALYIPRHVDIEEALIEGYEIPRAAASVSVSLDRVSVPMEEPRPRPVGRPRKNAPKRPVQRAFRMAYCGTVTLHDKDGNALHTIRYGRMPQGDERGLVGGMAGDVLALLRKRRTLKVQLLCDGAPEMWNRLDEYFVEDSIGAEIHKLVDFCHVVEKLGKAAHVIHGEAAPAVVARWRLALLNCRSAAEEIHAELRASGKEHVTDGDVRPVHDAITYLDNHEDRFDYAKARRLGLPIASGNVEATCKSLFNARMKRGGARWKEQTGEHVVQLRALALSDRWGDAMNLTLRPLRRAVRTA